MEYVKIEGQSLEYFNKLAKGPYDSDEFIHLSPGDVVTQGMFL